MRWNAPHRYKSLVIAAVGVSLCAMFAMVSLARGDNRMSVAELAEALRGGRIIPGMKSLAGSLPKPWVSVAYHDEDFEVLSGMDSFRDDRHFILLYFSGDTLFAACVVEQSPTWTEQWIFCDHDLMKDHIDRSMSKKNGD